MSESERTALKALMRGVSILMRYLSWQMLGKFDAPKIGAQDKRYWGKVLKNEASELFEESRKI